jgi:redox-sensitive bicupin YhaK (pirin superfamily)
MTDNVVMRVTPLGLPWETADPFLFCMYHNDAYPKGNEHMGPAASLAGRNIGQDFEGKDGWRMYHGSVVPGFPQHPHRGFETVTIMRRGYVDHSDSLGATARFGPGDVQWLTAGKGIVHSEMFPLLNREKPNPLELFQIWLNLPGSDKHVEPHFGMLWDHQIPRHTVRNDGGGTTEVIVVAGHVADLRAPAPPPHSWAARPEADVAIWTIKMSPETSFTLPQATSGSTRSIYCFRGGPLRIGEKSIHTNTRAQLWPEAEVTLQNGGQETELLLLQGRRIGEPVAQYGPFVMNTRTEIQQAFDDYRRTGFGGWPWATDDPVLPRGEGRYARHADGRVERVA